MANNGKGIGPNKLGASKQGNMGAGSVHAWDVSDNSSKKNQRNNFASKDGLNSPAKKNGMKYDIKEASDQNLTASARKHFAENAQHDSKKGYR